MVLPFFQAMSSTGSEEDIGLSIPTSSREKSSAGLHEKG
jgi:hypothetical protein